MLVLSGVSRGFVFPPDFVPLQNLVEWELLCGIHWKFLLFIRGGKGFIQTLCGPSLPTQKYQRISIVKNCKLHSFLPNKFTKRYFWKGEKMQKKKKNVRRESNSRFLQEIHY